MSLFGSPSSGLPTTGPVGVSAWGGGSSNVKAATAAPPPIDYTKLIGNIFGNGSSSAPSGPAPTAWTAKDGTQYDSKGNAVTGPGGKPLATSTKSQASSSGAGAAGSNFGITNTAQKDPHLETLANTVENRLLHPEDNTKKSIDTVGLALRDLESGQAKELKARGAERGTSGSGIEAAGLRDLASGTQGKVAAAAEDIATKQASANDAFMLNAGGALGAAGDAARQDRDLSGRLYIEDQQNRRAAEQAQLNQQIAVLNMLGNLGGLPT